MKNPLDEQTRRGYRLRIEELEAKISMLGVHITRLQKRIATLTGAPFEGQNPGESLEAVDLSLSANDADNDLMPQAIRDRNAAGAFIRSRGNVARALIELGYDLMGLTSEQRGELAQRVFGNNRVRALLQDSRSSLDVARESLIGQQVEDALYGDPEARARAFALLARVGGWFKPQQVSVTQRSVSIHSMLNGGDAGDLMAALEGLPLHEPGAPVKAGVLGAATATIDGDGQ